MNFEVKSQEVIEAMSTEERTQYFVDYQEHLNEKLVAVEKSGTMTASDIKSIKEQIANLNSEEIKSMLKAQKVQGEAIKNLMGKLQPNELTASEKSQIKSFIKENAEAIKNLKSRGAGTIEFETKAPETMTTGSALNPDGIPELVGTQVAPAGNVNLRGTIVDSLYSTLNTSLASYPYTETVPKDGDYSFVAESGIKPQIDFKVETRYAEPKKVAAHICLTEESVTDIAGLQSIATDYLRKKHDLKRQNGIIFGDGLGSNPLGAFEYGRAFVAGAMAGKVTNPNFMDVVNAIITDIYCTHNYQDEMHYMANLVLVNPKDYFVELVAAKDDNGLPLYPMASLMNAVVIGGATIVPFEDIPAGEIFVCDMSKYNVSNYVPYTVRIGWINDQFITNEFCMVGESRFHAFVRKLDEQAFVKDTIATVKAAIAAP